MSQDEHQELPDETLVGQQSCKGFPKTAWTVVAVLVLVSVLLQRRHQGQEQERESLNTIEQCVLDVQGQYLVAASQVPGVQKNQLYDSAKTLGTGPLFMRLRFVVLAGELAGPDEAIKQAAALEREMQEHHEQVSELDRRIVTVFEALYSDYQQGRWDTPSVPSRERQLLRDELGWFGALALSPERSGAGEAESAGPHAARREVLAPAWRTFLAVILISLCLLGLGVAGLAGAIILLVLVVKRKVRSAILTGSEYSAIYAETFAVWMLLFFALTVAASLVVRDHPDSHILVSSVASVLSLGALIWPALRGVPWSQVRRDTGLFLGDRPIREIFWGVICYVSNIPVLVIGITATLVLIQLYSSVAGAPGGLESMDTPTHPVVQWAGDAGWLGRAQIFLLACLVAPIIEETVFRGVLYRHLREGTCKWRTGASVAFSVGLTSLVFAVIHPQGLLAAPALMAVATGLSLAREWRGSLLAPMVMHATNNGLLMVLLFVLL